MNLNNIATEVIAILQKLPQSQAEQIGKLIQVLGSVGPILNSPTIASQKCDAEKLLLEIIQTNVDLEQDGGYTFQKEFENTVHKAQEAEQKACERKEAQNRLHKKRKDAENEAQQRKLKKTKT